MQDLPQNPPQKRQKLTVADLAKAGYKGGPSVLFVPQPKEDPNDNWGWSSGQQARQRLACPRPLSQHRDKKRPSSKHPPFPIPSSSHPPPPNHPRPRIPQGEQEEETAEDKEATRLAATAGVQAVAEEVMKKMAQDKALKEEKRKEDEERRKELRVSVSMRFALRASLGNHPIAWDHG